MRYNFKYYSTTIKRNGFESECTGIERWCLKYIFTLKNNIEQYITRYLFKNIFTIFALYPMMIYAWITLCHFKHNFGDTNKEIKKRNISYNVRYTGIHPNPILYYLCIFE